jgi:predicted pyridoxine 5'-phosphate oxidase superfamily flavin-nucleotide-binding protein
MDELQLRKVLGEPTELVRKKLAGRLNPLTRQFVERSPFVLVATGRPDGGLDVSPRGDPAGFSGSSTTGRSSCPSGRGTSSPTRSRTSSETTGSRCSS